MQPPRVLCPACRKAISADSFACRYCGAPVAAIWEDCRQGCHYLRMVAALLLASVIITIIVVVTMSALHETGLPGRNLAVIPALMAAAAVALWEFSDTLKVPPEPYHRVQAGTRLSATTVGLPGRLQGWG